MMEALSVLLSPACSMLVSVFACGIVFKKRYVALMMGQIARNGWCSPSYSPMLAGYTSAVCNFSVTVYYVHGHKA